MKIQQMLNLAVDKLKKNNISEPILKARILLSAILDKPKEYLIINNNKEINNQIAQKYHRSIEKLLNDIPLQYIINNQEFMKLNFYVDDNVLIPRQDTEILVEEVIRISKKINFPTILDLCCGSGAIAVSLAKYVQQSIILASDISKEALQITKLNAIKNNVNIEILKSDLFNNIINRKFDIIVSNPPYIKTEEILHLEKQVQQEPIIALDGGNDGLEIYRRIIKQAYYYLKTGGYLCLEIGFNQKKEIIELIKKKDRYDTIYSKMDLANKDRIIVCRKMEE